MLTGGLDLQYFDKDFEETANWDVLGTEMEKRYTPDKASNPNYALVVFKLQLKRKVVFSTYILTLPCVCLAVLTLAVFWLPPDRPDRTTLGRCASRVFTVLSTDRSQARMYMYSNTCPLFQTKLKRTCGFCFQA